MQQPRKQLLKFLLVGSLILTWFASKTSAQVNTYILQSPSLTQAQAACSTYGLTMVITIRQPDTYLVQLSTAVPPALLQQWVHGDSNVRHLELDTDVAVPVASGEPGAGQSPTRDQRRFRRLEQS